MYLHLYQGLKCPDIQLRGEVPFSNRVHLNNEFWKPELSAADEVMIESLVLMNNSVKFHRYIVVIYCRETVIQPQSYYSHSMPVVTGTF